MSIELLLIGIAAVQACVLVWLYCDTRVLKIKVEVLDKANDRLHEKQRELADISHERFVDQRCEIDDLQSVRRRIKPWALEEREQ